jgi:hypothetical protein
MAYLPINSAMYGQNFGTSIAMSSANSKNSFNLKHNETSISSGTKETNRKI